VPTVPGTNPVDTTDESTMTGLASQFFQRNFLNLYAFANAVYQTTPLVYGSQNTGSFGFQIGGGIDLLHQFETGTVSLGYRGTYSDYAGTNYENGTNQSLIFLATKRLSPRWSFSVTANAGISLYGGQYYGPEATGYSTPVTNPFSPETRFLEAGLVLSYRQTRRLSYSAIGSFFLSRYTGLYGVGTTGGIGAISASYLLNARTSLSGTYSHDAFYYQQNVGNTSVDSVFATLSHRFTRRTRVTLSGGVAHAGGSGRAGIPVKVIVDGQTYIVNTIVPFTESSWIPSFEGSVYHNVGRFVVSANGGQTITPGNGVLLASRDLFVNGYISRTWRSSNLSAGGGYMHIVSVSNSIRNALTGTYDSANLNVTYGHRLRRYLSAQAGFSYFLNGSIGKFGGISESRYFVGLTFSTKGIPLTLF
jgi:hypothetical protein